MHEPALSVSADDEQPPRELLVFDRRAVRAVDRAAIDEFGIPGIVLMENAARGLADRAMQMLESSPGAHRVLIVCGSGNNGGDGYAVARHLHSRRVEVAIASLGHPNEKSDADINRGICERMRLPIVDASQLRDADDFALIIDAIFGTGLDRDVSGGAARVIQWINNAERPVLAVDVPSGMDCDSGRALGACVRATSTVTFVGLKPGYLELDAQKLLGEVVVADIGVPQELLVRFGRRVAIPPRPDAPRRETPPAAAPARRRD